MFHPVVVVVVMVVL